MYEVVLRDGGIYKITKEQVEWWCSLYPDLDVKGELASLKELWTANAIPRKTARNINKFINKHLMLMNEENASY